MWEGCTHPKGFRRDRSSDTKVEPFSRETSSLLQEELTQVVGLTLCLEEEAQLMVCSGLAPGACYHSLMPRTLPIAAH